MNCGRLIAPKPGKKVGEKRRKKNDSSPLFSTRPGEEDDGAVQNGTVLVFFFFFFFFTVHETASFHLNGFGAKTRQIQISALHLRAFYNLVRLGFLQFSP